MIETQLIADGTVIGYSRRAEVPALSDVFSPLQIRLALSAIGRREDFEAWIQASNRSIQDEWEVANLELREDWPLLVAGCAALGILREELLAAVVR